MMYSAVTVVWFSVGFLQYLTSDVSYILTVKLVKISYSANTKHTVCHVYTKMLRWAMYCIHIKAFSVLIYIVLCCVLGIKRIHKVNMQCAFFYSI